MKRVQWALIVVLLLGMGAIASAAPPIPPPPAEWVTDTTGFLSKTARESLNARLQSYERTTGHQVLVWVGKTTAESPIEDWTVRAFQAWRVGRKGMDDGLVLFIMADDRTARIEVGYGLEGPVSDAIASRIIADVLIPRIKAGDRDGAVAAAVDQLIAAIGGAGTSAGQVPSPNPPGSLGLLQQILIGLLAIVVILVLIRYPSLAFYVFYVLSSLSGRGGDGRGGGGFGGGGGRSGGGVATGRW